MDFALSEEAKAIRDAAGRFANEKIAPLVQDYRRSNEMPHALVLEMAESGFLGGVIPTEWGGSEISYEALVAMVEEISTVDHVLAGHASQPSCLLGNSILRYGTDAQKERYLKRLCSGEIHGAVGMSEPQGGTDVATMTTNARRDNNDYIINGQKLFVSHVAQADFFLTFAQTDKSGDRKGICAFLIDRDTPGITINPIEDVGVLRPHSWGQVYYDDVRVSGQQRVGEEGDGLRVAMCALEAGRMSIAARCCGAVRHCIEAAAAYAADRVVFGKPISDYQLIQGKLADLATQLTAARMLVYRLAWMKDCGMPVARTDAAMAKVYATELLERAASDTIQIFGGYGLTTDYPWAQYLKDAKAFQVAEGTSEIQRVLIAEAVLGIREQGRFQLAS